MFSHMCFIMQIKKITYSAVLVCHIANIITTFVYNIWTYMWYQTVANKHMLHSKIGNNYKTATKIFLAAYIKLWYDCVINFLSFCTTISRSQYRALISQVLNI